MEQNRTVLITGGTSGIGEETALQLARLGWSVWIHGRNSEKVQTVVEKIKSATGNQQIFGITANLSDPKQLPNFVEQIQNQIPTLNVLINNAGLINDGFHNINEFEETWFV
ncbi:MAG TPA: SDR family NAD(P)-dependent oxidoreductase, partial [Pseudobdellovibrionaceae bacterium]|nr:SDR family NAD(P)-dependent oxidoreductase [Pseudobdellovibrionaceae bacterium]